MAKKIFIITLISLCLWSVAGPMAHADNALVQCGRGAGSTEGYAATDCNFAWLMEMINTIINWLIVISMPLAAIAFAYAGWLYLTAGDNSGQITKANHVFVSVSIGVALILASWLVFKLIADNFLNTSVYGTYLK